MSALAIIGIVLLVLFGGCAGLVIIVGATADKKDTKTKKEELVEVSAVDLHKEYDKNEVAADEKYKNKKLRVTGKINEISKNFVDDVVLQLESGEAFLTVHATMKDSEKKKAAKLDKGEEVTLECKGKGRLLSSAMLDDCVFE